MIQLENHMIIPSVTPEQWEADGAELDKNFLLEAWDNFSCVNRSKMDYLEKSKRFQTDPDLFNIDSMSSLEYSWLMDSVDNRIETFDLLYSDAGSFEYKGTDTDLSILFYQWWVSL